MARGRIITRAAAAAPELTRLVLPASVRVIDEEKRIVEVCATSESVDTFDTVFDYEASKDAFSRWAGNVREMHERKAVGRKVAVRFDDAAKKVYTTLRISKGAQDTWEKVKDGTLSGASIGAANVQWKIERRAGQDRQVAKRYDLMELSLVDLASNPDSRGLVFVRDGVADAVMLDHSDVGVTSPTEQGVDGIAGSNRPGATGSAPSPATSTFGGAQRIVEDAGSLSNEDPALAIARAALAQGQRDVADPQAAAVRSQSASVSAYQEKLARLGAPGFVGRAAVGANVEGEVHVGHGSSRGDNLSGAMAPGEGNSGPGVGQTLDVDGDHETPEDYIAMQSGPTAGAVMAPSPAGSVAHMAHLHHHTGRYDDPSNHTERGAHIHADGTQHDHEHMMDHDHGDHSGYPTGHSHLHTHTPAHSHYYRVADGSPLDARLVTAEQARTWEYVSASAFRAASGVEGKPLSVAQFRVAQGIELHAAQHAAESVASVQRAMGPYSRNPDGPADAGTPAQAEQHSSEQITGQSALGDGNGGVPASVSNVSDLEVELFRTGRCPLCQGQIRALDRDGQPVAGSDANGNTPDSAHAANKSGMVDVSTPPDGWTGRDAVAEITRGVRSSVQAEMARLLTAQQQSQRALEERLARIEAQPVGGGPVLRAAEKTTALSGGGLSGGAVAERLAAFESLAGRVTDPQAQMAVAAEMIRLQQEAAGLPPAFQAMPRAGGR